ncbi:hypothetical protein ACYSNX_11285 [Myroides sp. LJL115]
MIKKTTILLALISFGEMYAQSGIGVTTPHPTTALEISALDKGILIPRVTLLNELDTSSIKGGDLPESLLVYNLGNKTLIPGFYFWEDKKWNAILSNTTLQHYLELNNTSNNVDIHYDNGDYIFTWKDDNQVENSMRISQVIKAFESITSISSAEDAQIIYISENGVKTTVDVNTLLQKSDAFVNFIKQLISNEVVFPITKFVAESGISITSNTEGNNTTYTFQSDSSGIALEGDVIGNANKSRVVKIQGTALSEFKPVSSGQALVYDLESNMWIPGKPIFSTDDLQDRADLKTDNIIVIGEATSTVTLASNAVLAPTQLSIKDSSIPLTKWQVGSANSILTTDASGMPQWSVKPRTLIPEYFYLPPLQLSVIPGTQSTIDLYNIYSTQYGGSDVIKSDSSASLPIFQAEELNYYVIYYDKEVFHSLSINTSGVLSFTVFDSPKPSESTFLTVVLQVKK